jgi:hypothetical protein
MDMLDYQAEQGFSSWPTPMVPNGGRSIAHAEMVGGTVYFKGKKVQRDLNAAARMWPTPRASANENRTTHDAPSHGATHGKTLAGSAGSWQTITATDAKSRGYSYSQGDHRKPFLALTGQAQVWPSETLPSLASSPQDLTTLSGLTSSESSQSSPQPLRRKLNPAFVTWLMGLPQNWLSGGSISSGYLEMVSFRLLELLLFSILADD